MSVIETFINQILPYLILGGVIGFFLSKLTSNNSKSFKAMEAAFVKIAREERRRLQENIEGDMQEERTQRNEVNTLVFIRVVVRKPKIHNSQTIF